MFINLGANELEHKNWYLSLKYILRFLQIDAHCVPCPELLYYIFFISQLCVGANRLTIFGFYIPGRLYMI